MNKTKKELEQIWKKICSKTNPDFDLPIYKDIPLPMVMVQGWFNDQIPCFELFRQKLTDKEQAQLFTTERNLESVNRKYLKLWGDGGFSRKVTKDQGAHKWLPHLNPKHFGFWTERVLKEIDSYGGLKAMLDNLGTVEAAHDRFKRFYKTRRVRILGAADTARLFAKFGHLIPEERPLLARGALRGAAILLGGACPENNTDAIEREYRQEYKRVELEKEAASYIDATEELVCFGKWKMEKGESIFCELQKQPGVNIRSRRRKG